MKSFKVMKTMGNNQSGAALVVGLIVLLIMTLLAVASMGSMTTELRVAANVQNQNTAFQVATAAIEAAKVDPSIVWVATGPSGGFGAIPTQPAAYTSDNAQAAATIVYSGCKTVVSGDSMTAEGGSQFYVHEIQVTGQALDGGGNVVSSSNQVLGLISAKVASC